MLFMIDTCQANTMYSRFYSPNIIATGSSEIDESSYSHHADNDVGVAVIDRYTYYNLEFLETQVTSPSSKLTLGNLFDSYDESQIHSRPGVRWDLFQGGEARGRDRLVMDFLGNVQEVEVQGGDGGAGIANDTEWQEDLRRLGEILQQRRRKEEEEDLESSSSGSDTRNSQPEAPGRREKRHPRKEGAAKVEAGSNWTQRVLGASTLLGCGLLWGGATWLEKSR